MQLHPAYPQKIKIKSCCAGSKTRPIYEYKKVEGWDIPRRVKSGEMDFHDYIQQCKDDVDYITLGKTLIQYRENVAAHFKADGKDISVVDVPRNLGEYDIMYKKMKDSFGQLPDEVKGLFNDDLQVFADAWFKGTLKGTLDTYGASLKAASQAHPAPSKEGE